MSRPGGRARTPGASYDRTKREQSLLVLIINKFLIKFLVVDTLL